VNNEKLIELTDLDRLLEIATINQPRPTKNNAPPVDERLIRTLKDNQLDELALMVKARSDLGLDRYGDRLRPFNGRDALVDLMQELLDAMFYITQKEMEFKAEAGGDGEDDQCAFSHILPVLMRMCEDLRKAMK